MFLKLKINTNERIGNEDVDPFTDVLVNMDLVQTVSPRTNSGAGKTNIRFEDGHALVCGNSLDYILAAANGTLESGYKAPEPKDA